VEAKNPSSIAASLAAARENGRIIREVISYAVHLKPAMKI
jgi:uncharacterized alpha-E superfamily protein